MWLESVDALLNSGKHAKGAISSPRYLLRPRSKSHASSIQRSRQCFSVDCRRILRAAEKHGCNGTSKAAMLIWCYVLAKN